MDRALYDFAEAAMGKNTAMSWSLSEAVLRRQVTPVFKRCSRGDLSAEQALDIALDFVGASVTNIFEIFSNLFKVLESRIDVQMHGQTFPALAELEEFFMGLNTESQWSTDKDITQQEFHPLFLRVASGNLTVANGVYVFCDTVIAKKDYYLELIKGMCVRLTQQLLDKQAALEANGNGSGHSNGRSNGDD